MSFKTFCLLVIIFGSAIFIYIKIASIGNENSSFNRTSRFSLGKSEFLRNIFGLHNDGDARKEYLIGTTPILVEYAESPGDPIPDAVRTAFEGKIKQLTGRDAKSYSVDPVPSGTLTDENIRILMEVRKRNFEPGSPIIMVFSVDNFQAATNSVGKTYQEYGIILSGSRLKDTTQNSPEALPAFQLSTLMHEFGHQVGLDHNDQENCIMNPEVELPVQTGIFANEVTSTDYCSFELDQLQTIKQQLQN